MTILDTYGLTDLTMRRLATTLGVQAGTLYWHFANKQTLLSALADEILASLPAPGGAWPTAVQTWAARLHALLRSHRSGAELVSSVLSLRPWDESPGRAVEQLMVDGGVASDTAKAAAAGVLHLVLGHSIDEEQTAQLIELGVRRNGTHENSTALLDEAVSLLVSGIQAS